MEQGLARRASGRSELVATATARVLPASDEVSPDPSTASTGIPDVALRDLLIDGTLHCSIQGGVVVLSPNRAISDGLVSLNFKNDLLKWAAGERELILDLTTAEWLGHDEIFFPILDAAAALKKRGMSLVLVTRDDGLRDSMRITHVDRGFNIRFFDTVENALDGLKVKE
jgi:hypothetical protein